MTENSTRDEIRLWLDQYAMKESIKEALQALEETNKTAVVLYYLSDWTQYLIWMTCGLNCTATASSLNPYRRTNYTASLLHFMILIKINFLQWKMSKKTCWLATDLAKFNHLYIEKTYKQVKGGNRWKKETH
ncbi:hypothetical protein MALU111345_18695 [Marinicrinis lubricantis]